MAPTLYLLPAHLQHVLASMVSLPGIVDALLATNNDLGYSMRFEALNTQIHESHWAPGQKLRHNKIIFVSAGGTEEATTKTNEEAMADMTLQEVLNASVQKHETVVSQRLVTSTILPKQMNEELEEASTIAQLAGEDIEETVVPGTVEDEITQDDAEEETGEETFIIDTAGSQPFTTGLPPPRICSPSPAPSDSSEEVILFGGRDSSGRPLRRASPVRTAKSFQRTITDDVKTMSTKSTPARVTNPLAITAASGSKYRKPSIAAVGDKEDAVTAVIPEKKAAPTPRGPPRSQKQILEDELMTDYIENLKEQGLDPSAPYNQRELGGTDDDDQWADELEEEEKNILEERNEGWTKSDLSDFDNLSTSDGNIGIIEEILSKRDRKSGAQYLIVWEGTSMDEARWVPELLLVDKQAKEMIDKFLVEEQLTAEAFCTDSESDSDEDDDLLNGPDDDDDIDDDAELIMERQLERKIGRMSDEQIARLLAKQEELGMGTDSLMLFDGLDGDEGEVEEEDDEDDWLPSSASRRRPRANKTPKRAKGEFPSATLTADAYDGFDVMDFERPSISAKKRIKARKGKPILDISDSELERSMADAWDLDRMKKSAKKREREELRAAGLLGKGGAGKPDMKSKYKEGMNIEDIKEELKDFLMGSNTTLSLSPMDKTYRKIVHDIANAFNLKSKSVGKGNTRFPVVYRTQRTMAYSETTFRRVEGKVSRFLPRSDVKGKRPIGRGVSRGNFGGVGGGGAAGGYRDGDIVGGSAKELGIENRGRAMLEKMGWSSGTALGALNNKGILEPVSHVVKTTKAGLG